MAEFPIDKFKAQPGEPVNLESLDPNRTPFQKGKSKHDTKGHINRLNQELILLQKKIIAEGKNSVLIVFQAMDAGGKDGSIKKVFSGLDPNGLRTAAFKKPTDLELKHDFLWRVHAQTPSKGEIVLFNRSHYEDVLIVRVMDLVEQSIWQNRYQHIVDFERLLYDEGTIIIKFFLHISKEEQKLRLQKRLDDPDKNWKFKEQDLEHRKLWDDYQIAFQDAISQTTTKFAPWYIVPSNHKWYRDIVVGEAVVQTLRSMHPEYPKSIINPKEIIIPD